MNLEQVRELWPFLTAEERVQVWAEVQKDGALWRPFPGPQSLAYDCQADVIGYGGAAGGGKSALIAGWALEKSERMLVLRSDKAQTAGVIQYLEEVLGTDKGLNRQIGFWNIPNKLQTLVEFGGLKDPGAHKVWQGRAHDKVAVDEATECREYQVRFVIGWNRSSNPALKPQTLLTFNPPMDAKGRWIIAFFAPWLDRKHPHPALPGELRWFTSRDDQPDYEVPDGRPFVWGPDKSPVYQIPPGTLPVDVIQPQSRTFYPARVTDNPVYMATNYLSTLQALQEPMRSKMLYGDFDAGVEDSEWQCIPTAWIEAAMARWKKPDVLDPMDCMGVDVARGGKDSTVLAMRHGNWFDELVVIPGKDCRDGFRVLAAVAEHLRDDAMVAIDVVGVGASPFDLLRERKYRTMGVVAGATATGSPRKGRLRFFNTRSQLVWQFRELLDPEANNGVALPPDRALLADLCAYWWRPSGDAIQVASREEIIDEIGRSPDRATAVIQAAIPTVPSRVLAERRLEARKRKGRRTYNPIEGF